MVSILYLNGQKYLEQARDYRTNYTQLHILEMKIKDDKEDLTKIGEEYCKLLNSSSNHIEYDYLKAISNSNDEYKQKKGWEKKKQLYHREWFWRFALKIIILLIPIGLLIACEVWA